MDTPAAVAAPQDEGELASNRNRGHRQQVADESLNRDRQEFQAPAPMPFIEVPTAVPQARQEPEPRASRTSSRANTPHQSEQGSPSQQGGSPPPPAAPVFVDQSQELDRIQKNIDTMARRLKRLEGKPLKYDPTCMQFDFSDKTTGDFGSYYRHVNEKSLVQAKDLIERDDISPEDTARAQGLRDKAAATIANADAMDKAETAKCLEALKKATTSASAATSTSVPLTSEALLQNEIAAMDADIKEYGKNDSTLSIDLRMAKLKAVKDNAYALISITTTPVSLHADLTRIGAESQAALAKIK
jgi:hypothetical protein